MARHAAPRNTRSFARRATAVSTGTLVLCLGTAAPVFAETNPPPLPQPVSSLVQTVSSMTGLPNPVPPSEPAPRRHRAPSHHRRTAHQAATRVVPSGPVTHRAVTPMAVSTRSVTFRPAAELRSINPPAAAPDVQSQSSALPALPAIPVDSDTARVLLVAVATMILGALASSHIKAAQTYVFAR